MFCTYVNIGSMYFLARIQVFVELSDVSMLIFSMYRLRLLTDEVVQ